MDTSSLYNSHVIKINDAFIRLMSIQIKIKNNIFIQLNTLKLNKILNATYQFMW